MPKRGYNKTEWGLIGAFFLLGLIGLTVGGGSVMKGLASRAWPTVNGEIAESGVLLVRSTMGGHASSGTPAYRPDVTYTYQVSGESYTGTRLFLGSPERYSMAHATRIASAYKPGQRIPVSYKASDPSESVLEPGLVWEGASFTISISAGGALLFVISGAGLAHGIWRALRGKRPPEGGVSDAG